MIKKYELLTNDTIIVLNKTLYRIKALVNFANVKAGDLGGYIEKEENLSHKGNCWVYDNAKVYGNAIIRTNAKIRDNAEVYDNAEICGTSTVFDDAKVYGNARISTYAKVYCNAKVYGNAIVRGAAKIYDSAEVYDNAIINNYTIIYQNAMIYGDATIYQEAQVYGNARIYGIAKVYGNAKVYDDAIIHGAAEIHGYANIFDYAEIYGNTEVCEASNVFGHTSLNVSNTIRNNAYISGDDDYVVLKGFGTRNTSIIFYKCEDNNIMVSSNDFVGFLDRFKTKLKEDNIDNKHNKEYLALIKSIEIHFELDDCSNRKYELTDEIMTLDNDIVLHRIKALKDFGYVIRGDLGGWIEGEKNLSHEGLCWVDNEAKVYGNAKICNNAVIDNNAKVYDNAIVFDNVVVLDNAEVYGDAQVYDRAEICGDAKVLGNVEVHSNTRVGTGAKILSNGDYVIFEGCGFPSTTFYKCEDGIIRVVNDRFTGIEKEFRNNIKNTNKDYYAAYIKFIDIIYIHFGLDIAEVEKDE
jgi:UDP-3-O-[3-hydroxymyristoyl] glucosamine N-acyltransferase